MRAVKHIANELTQWRELGLQYIAISKENEQ